MKSACRLCLLDLGNVLIKFDHAIIARRLSKLSGKSALVIVSQFIQSGLGERFDEGAMGAEEFVARVIKDLALGITPDEFKRIWNDIFVENSGMEPLVKKLKQRYPVFVISDTNPLHFEFVKERFPILRHIDQFILSYEVGVRKPHPLIFEEVLRRAGTAAEEIFFTDDRKENIEGAARLGFLTHRFKDAASFERVLRQMSVLS
jgi:putative hydrolase of the HAD superfamily